MRIEKIVVNVDGIKTSDKSFINNKYASFMFVSGLASFIDRINDQGGLLTINVNTNSSDSYDVTGISKGLYTEIFDRK